MPAAPEVLKLPEFPELSGAYFDEPATDMRKEIGRLYIANPGMKLVVPQPRNVSPTIGSPTCEDAPSSTSEPHTPAGGIGSLRFGDHNFSAAAGNIPPNQPGTLGGDDGPENDERAATPGELQRPSNRIPVVNLPTNTPDLERPEWEADKEVTTIYSEHFRSLVRLSHMLVGDPETAKDVVQEAFIAMHGAWRRLREPDKAVSYLRQSVVNRSRSVLRHRMVVDRNAPKPAPDMPSAEQGAISLLERSAVISALRTLPPRQREAMVLKYYGDYSEAMIAGAMGISRGAVKGHTSRALASLRKALEDEI